MRTSEVTRFHLSLQALHDILVETVFPTCAMILRSDDNARHTSLRMSHLASGEAHREGRGGAFYAGSRVEGLAIENNWGHPQADNDIMGLHGVELGVRLPKRHEPRCYQARSLILDKSCLEYAPEECPPAFTRIRVTKPEALLRHPWVDVNCIMKGSDGSLWLLPSRMNEKMQRGMNEGQANPAYLITESSGPAGQVQGGLVEFVPTLVANAPHPAIDDFIQRSRSSGWPSQDQLDEVQQIPLKLVLVGHKTSSRNNQEARLSWSPSEILLISNLPAFVKQGYIALKYTLKFFMKDKNTSDGRGHVGSYHTKTALLYYLENSHPSKICSPFGLMIALCHELSSYLNQGFLPHYFLPECNLLETVGPVERQDALQAIQAIISDPVAALLQCPSEPSQIFGSISPDELVDGFHGVVTHPACERSRESLLQLLSRLDEWRQQRYAELQQTDETGGVSGRPQIRRLVDMVENIPVSD